MLTFAAFAIVESGGIGAAPAAAEAPESPATLEECYLNVAMHKSTADMVYLAREICDAVFKRQPRALTVLDPKTKDCDEWWFDEHGRTESGDRYCSLVESGPQTWQLACRWKNSNPDAYSFVELRERSGRMELVGQAHGRALGAIFTSLSACVEHKLGVRDPDAPLGPGSGP
jgi:hypothetical protein